VKAVDKSRVESPEQVEKSDADTSVRECYHKDVDKSCVDTSERVREYYHYDRGRFKNLRGFPLNAQ